MHPRVRPDRGGALAPDRGGREGGIVVQAVLVTVMVMAIGLLAVISRVASSRDGAAASSLAAAARQAAEFGFSEIVAEMNRDGKNYLWITPFSSWNSVSEADLKACGIYSASAPVSSPIEGVASSKSLPGSSELSYQISNDQASPGFQPPEGANTCTSGGISFANRKGGTAILTIIGTAKRASGDVTTYTLKRLVSVAQASPTFQRSVFSGSAATPESLSTIPDPRFTHFPSPSSLGVSPVPAQPWQSITCSQSGGGGGGASIYSCGSENFDNRLELKFPYTSSGQLASFCRQGTAQIVCMLSSLTLNDDVQLVVSVQAQPVALFISGDLLLNSNANLCSDTSSTAVAGCTSSSGSPVASGSWSRLRLFGRSAAASCDQQIQISGNSVNIHNAFLWFPTATLTYPTSISTVPAGLPGWICSVKAPASSVSIGSVTSDQLFAGLADPSFRLLAYRGYGSQEQPP